MSLAVYRSKYLLGVDIIIRMSGIKSPHCKKIAILHGSANESRNPGSSTTGVTFSGLSGTAGVSNSIYPTVKKPVIA